MKFPLYWFDDYWLNEIYVGGVESTIRRHASNLPLKTPDYYAEVERGHVDLFFWKPIIGIASAVGNVPCMIPKGFTLFAKTVAGKEFEPVVYIEMMNDGYRLYAGRDFALGNAIIFFSKFEESTGELVLGGSAARVGENMSECNVILIGNRLLRCVKAIKHGEEIVLYKSDIPSNDQYYHLIDRVVVNIATKRAGRIGQELLRDPTSLLVRYDDLSTEVFQSDDDIAFAFRSGQE